MQPCFYEVLEVKVLQVVEVQVSWMMSLNWTEMDSGAKLPNAYHKYEKLRRFAPSADACIHRLTGDWRRTLTNQARE
jgi:hypothetical protein